jgi:hypothetical protein
LHFQLIVKQISQYSFPFNVLFTCDDRTLCVWLLMVQKMSLFTIKTLLLSFSKFYILDIFSISMYNFSPNSYFHTFTLCLSRHIVFFQHKLDDNCSIAGVIMIIMFVTSLAVFIKVYLFSVLIDLFPKWVNFVFFINFRTMDQFIMTLNVNEIVKV